MRWTDHHYLDLYRESQHKKAQVVEPVITVESIAAKFVESKLGLGLKFEKPIPIEPIIEPVIESVDINMDIKILSALRYPNGTEVIVKYEDELYRIMNNRTITPYNVELLSRIVLMYINYITII